MLRTLEAVIDKTGSVQLMEPIQLSENRRALVVILDDRPVQGGGFLRPFGLCSGDFVVPDGFDEPLPDEILALFETA